jgi:hypothetical protein
MLEERQWTCDYPTGTVEHDECRTGLSRAADRWRQKRSGRIKYSMTNSVVPIISICRTCFSY